MSLKNKTDMTKVGIKKIGFVPADESNDSWEQQQQVEPIINDRGAVPMIIVGLKTFKKIDQKNSDLEQNMVSDDNGRKYDTSLRFTVREESDITMAQKYTGRPVVMHVWTIDGKKHTIGTKDYPATMVPSDRYKGLDTREVEITVDYSSLSPIIS